MNKKTEELEALLDKVKADNSRENQKELLELLQTMDLYIPAILPPGTDPALIRQMMQNSGKRMALPKGLSVRPAVLENQEGKRFLPVFSQKSQMEQAQNKTKYPLVMGMPFPACVNLLNKEKGLDGIVINPFTQNVSLNNLQQSRQAQPLTEAQHHALLRQQMEAGILPNALFEQKGALVNELIRRKGACLEEFYQELYQKAGRECPYAAGDFEIMALHIRENLTVLQISMPPQKLTAGTCPTVLVTWNEPEERLGYFGIVLGKQQDSNRLIQALPDGKKKDFGPAPQEGSELNYIISIVDDNSELL